MDSFEVVHIEVSPGRSDFDALLFLKTVLKRCRGQTVIVVDRGPWYNWALDDLDLCEHAVKRGERSLVEAWFDLFKYRTRLFYSRFPTEALGNQSLAGPKPSLHSTMPSLNLDTLGPRARSCHPRDGPSAVRRPPRQQHPLPSSQYAGTRDRSRRLPQTHFEAAKAVGEGYSVDAVNMTGVGEAFTAGVEPAVADTRPVLTRGNAFAAASRLVREE